MTEKIYNVLFLCTGNSARSILAESILAKEGVGRFNAYSAGSQPKGEVNPHALKELAALGYLSTGFTSKSWDVFAGSGAPEMDFIFTVCDNAAGEACPVWIGHPMTAHWGVEDPAAVVGSELEVQRAFAQAARFLKNRITAFVSLPLQSIDRMALETRLRNIGAMEGSTAPQGKST
ncbi:arsenate reductase ArsC [Agrobacterium arsenijevicii]|uniref:ArsR family transcriptional regulator n=1 Tax=Agrobacterium arsenijevicii TaxID=1585697 RepID=A0ABR5DCW8_9HYPH|nr:ArsR family transcriptional regulator [Agrobacterium arsenijevicii]